MAHIFKADGLITNRNELDKKEGALERADNVNIDDEGRIEPRRGFSEYGDVLANPTNRVDQLITYKDKIIRHDNTAGTLEFDSDGLGGFDLETSAGLFDGTYNSPTETILNSSRTLKMKSAESNSNLYFTTDQGVKKMSAETSADLVTSAGFITQAGGVKAVDVKAKITTSATGFLAGLSKCAYRVVWGIKDKNNNFIFGTPSERVILSNPNEDVNVKEVSTITFSGTTSANVDGKYILFSSENTDYFVWWKDAITVEPISSETVGRTAIEVDISDAGFGDTASEFASHTATAISNDSLAGIDFTTSSAGGVVTITVKDETAGDVTDISEETGGITNVSVETPIQGSTTSAPLVNAKLTFTVPQEITSLAYDGIAENYFYQIYRTQDISSADATGFSALDPGDEMNLVIESGLTLQQHTTDGEVQDEEDVVTESFRAGGTPLYTNPLSGLGILSSNDKPPIAKDLALFRDSMFYANTQTPHRKQIELLSVDDMTSLTSSVVIGNASKIREYTFVGETELTDITCDTQANTTNGGRIDINSAENERQYYMWMHKSGTESTSDPAVTEKTGIRIDIQADTSEADVATSFRDEIEDHSDFDIYRKVEITNFGNLFSGTDDTLEITNALEQVTFTFVTGTPGVDEVEAVTDEATTAANLTTAINDHDDLSVTAIQSGANVYISDNPELVYVDGDAMVGLDLHTDVVSIRSIKNGNVDAVTTDLTGVWAVANVIDGDGENEASNHVLLSSLISVSQAVDETARSLVHVINSDASSDVNAFYLSGPDDLPGIMLFESRGSSTDQFFMGTTDSAIVGEFNPELPEAKAATLIDSTDEKIDITAHGFANDQKLFVYGEFSDPYETDSDPALYGEYYVVNSDTNDFELSLTKGGASINFDTSSTTLDGFFFKADVSSDNEVKANRLYYSKVSQPEAVPQINYIDVGPKDEPILRIVALRDNLMVLKTDGIYLLSGPSAPNWSVRLIDSSTKLFAPETIAVLNNQIFALSSQGVVRISEVGAFVISRDIEDKILEIMNDDFDYSTIAFGVAYESERVFHLWLPTETTDTVGTQCYRYNTFTRAWTRWTKQAKCGIVNPSDDVLYLGSGDRAFVDKERKNRSRKDHSDRDFAISFPTNFYSGLTIRPSVVTGIIKGDAMVQTQRLTLNDVNQLLLKLDIDPGLDDSDYFALHEIVPGDNLGLKMDAINDKLTADDASIADLTPFDNSNFVTLQTQYNNLIAEINDTASDAVFVNYKNSTGSVDYEALITDVNLAGVEITVAKDNPLIAGAASVFKKFDVEIVWAAQHFGDPNKMKHLRDASILFDQTSFRGANVGFATDISPEFELQEFVLEGSGDLGGFGLGSTYLGGLGDESAIRTLVPLEKARCRHIRTTFIHKNARNRFIIQGVSYELRPVSTRAWR